MEKPTYYAVIPAPVRYDPTLVPNAKLLYGEITVLANKSGYCWATNGHFAELYGVHSDTVSEWVTQLANNGHILVTQLKKGRRIHLTGSAKMPRGVGKKAEHNNTSSNNIVSKDTIATPVAFSLDETLKKWESGSVRRMDILAWYFRKAGFVARSKKELDNLIHRHIRAASKLEVYTDDELVAGWKKAKALGEKLNFDPTLDTVLKQLTQ